jgi:autotransporter adhesin
MTSSGNTLSTRAARTCPNGDAHYKRAIVLAAAAAFFIATDASAQAQTESSIGATRDQTGSIELGSSANAIYDSIAIGDDADAIGKEVGTGGVGVLGSTAIGVGAAAGSNSTYGATAIGANATALGTHATALGSEATARAENTVAIGNLSQATRDGAIGIGNDSQAFGLGSVSIGDGASADGSGAVAIGRNASAGGARSVAIGIDSNATRANSVDIGNRVITHVGAGTLETDAANVQQLKGVANALGGNAGVNTNGAIVAPSYTIGNEVHATVGSALANLDKRVDENASGIEAINTAIKTAVSTARVVSYEDATLATVKFAGKSGTRLSNVAAGDISATSTDAINGKQISDLSKGFEAKIDGLDLRVASLENKPDGNGGSGGNGGNAGNNGEIGNNGNAGANGNAESNGANGGNGNAGANGNNGNNGNAGTAGSNGSNGGNGNNSGGGTNRPDSIIVVDGAGGVVALPTQHAISVGTPGNERRITNVANGLDGTDAVNLNQLNTARQSAVEQSKKYTDLRFGQTQSRINEVGRTAYSGVAMAMAMPNIAPAKAGSTVVAAGSAGFQGYAALGLGVTYRSPNGQMLLNGALAYSGSGGTAARVQVGYEF